MWFSFGAFLPVHSATMVMGSNLCSQFLFDPADDDSDIVWTEILASDFLHDLNRLAATLMPFPNLGP